MKQSSRNLFSFFSADIVRRLLGFATVAYLAHVLGKEGFGLVNHGFAVLAYSMVLNTTGFIKTDNADDMARKIKSFFVSDLFHHCEQTRARIREYAERKYSWSNIGRQIFEIYSSLFHKL